MTPLLSYDNEKCPYTVCKDGINLLFTPRNTNRDITDIQSMEIKILRWRSDERTNKLSCSGHAKRIESSITSKSSVSTRCFMPKKGFKNMPPVLMKIKN
jgi:hypothetical protein